MNPPKPRTLDETALELYDYQLPHSCIAQQPLPQRDQARLLADMGERKPPQHLKIADLPELLSAGDVVVANDARVLKARLKLHKVTGGGVEVLVLRPAVAGREYGATAAADWHGETAATDKHDKTAAANKHGETAATDRRDKTPITTDNNPAKEVWEALVRPSRRVPPDTQLLSADGQAVLVVGQDLGEGKRLVWPVGQLAMADLLAKLGEVPLPPYITEPVPDSERYQTVLADRPTAVAAPTAGLHLTSELLAQLQSRDIAVHRLNLAVGLGTFRPITTASITDHLIHEESYQIPQSTWDACLQARAAGNKVVAIGTTVVRSLEAANLKFEAWEGPGETQGAALGLDPQADPLVGSTSLYIFPGFRFQMVDALLTNFHLPRSTLLVLLAAFMGQRWRQLYETALREGYRFLSFGDAMFCARQP